MAGQSNTNEGISWTTGLIITLLLVGAVIGLYEIGYGYYKRSQETIAAQSQSLAQGEFAMYNNTSVTGQDVIEVAQRYKDRPQFSIVIVNGLNFGGFYTLNTSTSPQVCYNNGSPSIVQPCVNPTSVDQLQDTSSTYYVNPTARFNAWIHKDANGEIRRITFYQK